MPKIIQYHSSITSSDAIGHSIGFLHEFMLGQGYDSLICSAERKTRQVPGVLDASDVLNSVVGSSIDTDDVLLVHVSFLDEIAERLAALPLQRVIVYHNVTPSRFFREAGQEGLAWCCDAARAQLARMGKMFHAAVGDSLYNSAELVSLGYRNVGTIPVMFHMDEMREGAICPQTLADIRSGAEVNILFVGRFVPNKRIDLVIETLAQFKKSFPLTIHLHLVGKVWDEQYFARLLARAGELGVASQIRLHLDASPLRLRTLYAAADAFVCLSEHEGFMVPVAEAFAAGCPVIAASAAAIPETMGGAGLLISEPDPAFAAGLVYLLHTDRDLRRRVIADQARRVAALSPRRSARRWLDLVESLRTHAALA